jgi:hypothetical protein
MNKGDKMAEALTDLWGVETTIVEMADHVLPEPCLWIGT